MEHNSININVKKIGDRSASIEPDKLSGLSFAIQQILSTIETVSDKVREHVEALEWTVEHLDDNELNIGVLGQFNSGKSSFINSLLSEQLLPISILPLTNIFIHLKVGDTNRVQIDFIKGPPLHFEPVNSNHTREIISHYATEEGNPGNVKSVSRVTLYHPSFILNDGIVFIDTPGVSSPTKTISKAVFNNLSHFDAIFFILSADNLITEDEIEFIKSATEYNRHIYFVINKIDHLDLNSLEPALEHAIDILRKTNKTDTKPLVFGVSALYPDMHKMNDPAFHNVIGIESVKSFLSNYIINNKSRIIYESGKYRIMKIITDIQSLTISQMSLKHKKIKELNQTAAYAKQFAAELEKKKNGMSDILGGDANRAVVDIQLHVESLRSKLLVRIESILIDGYIDYEKNHERHKLSDIKKAIINFLSAEWSGTSDVTGGIITGIINNRINDIIELMELASEKTGVKFDNDISATIREKIRESNATKIEISDWHVAVDPLPRNPLLGKEKSEAAIRERIHIQAHGIVNKNIENMRWILTERIHASLKIAEDCIVRMINDAIKLLKEATDAESGNIKTLMDGANNELHSLENIHSRLNEISKYLEAISKLP
jgi:ribosome biogenesis GTPase A